MFDHPRRGLAALALALAACGAPPAPAPTPTAPASATAPATLKNGLVVHARPTPGADAVTLQLWIPAGAMHAQPSSAATLAARVAERRLARALAPFGGTATSWARADAAVLSITVAATHLTPALDALAAAVRTPATGPDLDAARPALAALTAAAQRDPDRLALRRLIAEAWGDHPAARPLLGGDPEITADALATLHTARYRPDGAALIAVGAVDPAALRAAARAAFAGWTGAAPPIDAAPTPVGGQLFVEAAPGGASRLRLGWPVTVATPADAAALDLLAHALTADDDAPLPAALARAGIAARVDAFVHAPTPAGLLIVAVDGPPDAAEALWFATRAGLDAAGRAPLSPGRLARTVAAIEQSLDAPRTLGARALRWPDDLDGRGYHAALAAASPDALAARARALTPDVALALVVTPTEAEALAARLTAATPTLLLPPGITLDVAPTADRATAGLHLDLPAGAATVPDPLLGAAHLAAAALGAPIAGAAPTVELAPERMTLALTVPAARLDDAIATLGERVMRPRWTPATVERARADARAARSDADPVQQARALAVRRAAIERGVSLPAREEVDAGLETLPPARLGGWYDAFVTHAPLRLTVVTDRPAEQITRAVASAFGPDRHPIEMRALRPPPDAPAEAPADEPAAPAPTSIVRTTTRPDAAHVVGWSLPRLDGEAHAAIELALALLGDAAEGEGVVVTRELTVGPDGGHALVAIGGLPAPVRAARARLDAQLARLTQIAIEDDARRQGAQRLVGRRTVELDAPDRRAAFIATHARAGRPYVGDGARAAWQAAIERTRAVTLLEATRAHLAPARRIDVRVAPVIPPDPS